MRRFLLRLSPGCRTGEGEHQFVHSSEMNMTKLTRVERVLQLYSQLQTVLDSQTTLMIRPPK